MKRAFIAAVLLWIASAHPALACGLEDCTLPDAAHLESPKYKTLPNDEFAWMNHDLALARSWLADGRSDKTLQIVEGLDYAIRVRQDRMVAVRGKARVRALHVAIEDLEVAAGGYPLAELDFSSAKKKAPAAADASPADATASVDPPAAEHAQREASDEPDRARRDPASHDRTVETTQRERPEPEPSGRELPRP